MSRIVRLPFFTLYLLFVVTFPLALWWVEHCPLTGPTVCIFRQITHLDCPSCGLTRAFRAMGRLDVPGAFRYNPLGPAIFVAVTLCWAYAVGWLITGGRLQPPRWWMRQRRRILTGGFIVFLLAGAGRIWFEIYHPPPPPRAPSIHLPWPYSKF